MIDSDQFPIVAGAQGREGDDIEQGVFAWGIVLFCLIIILVAGVFIAKAFGMQ